MNFRPYYACALASVFALYASSVPAAQPKISIEDAKAYALKICLDRNYERTGGYVARDLKDESYLPLRYQLSKRRPDAEKRLRAFTESSTADYYLAQVPMKDEDGRRPFNKVFALCVTFYRSKELNDFLSRELR
jgi:hypothetical protein